MLDSDKKILKEDNLILNFSLDSLKVTRSFAQSVSAFKRLMKYHKKYVIFVVVTIAISILRAYLFTLEPIYTSLIIDKVIVGGNTSLLPQYLIMILLAGIGFGFTNFLIASINGIMSTYS